MISEKKRFALIDVGSSSLTMKIAELSRGEAPRIIETVRGNLALGEDTYTHRRISDRNVDLCCEILQGFRLKLEEYRITDYRVVATSAVREAENKVYVLMQIRHKTGFEVEVLDNGIERYFHNVAISEAIPEFSDLIEEGVIILDISSGSVQVSAFRHSECHFSHNLRLGVLRINEMMDRLRGRSRDYIDLMNEYVDAEINDFKVVEPGGMTYPHLIALYPGSIFLHRLAGEEPDRPIIRRKSLQKIYQVVCRVSPDALNLDYQIPSDIAELLLPATLIIRKYANYNDLKRIYLPQTDIGDGILTALAARAYHYTPNYDHRSDTVSLARHLASRFRYDKGHTDFVEVMSLRVFDALKKRYGMSERDRLLLQLAAILHDTGKFIHLNRHSERSFNIINFIELIGLSEAERQRVAWIARLHSSSRLPSQTFLDEIGEQDMDDIIRPAAILRMVDALDASHRQKFISVKPKVKGATLILRYETNDDVTLEEASLKGKGLLFETVFGLRPELVVKKR